MAVLYTSYSWCCSSKSFISYTTCKTCYYGVYKSYDRPYEELEQGVYAITTEDIRWLRCDIKSLNLLGNVLAKEYAVKYNAAEAIQHRGDIVTEGASSNVYAIKDGVIYTHPVNNFILNGITRRVIKWIAEDEQIPFKEETFTVEFLKSADEVIISSTSEVMPITKLMVKMFKTDKLVL